MSRNESSKGKQGWPSGTSTGVAMTSLGRPLPDDLFVMAMLPLFDSVMLITMCRVDKADKGIIEKYRTQLPYATALVRSARAFLVIRISSLHASCRGWPPGTLESASSVHMKQFTSLLIGPRKVLLTEKQAKDALKIADRIDDTAVERWPWKSVIRFLLPVAASYGDLWPDASFAIEVCARSLKNGALLALFAPDPCQVLEAIAFESKDELGISLAAILGTMIRTATAATAPIVLPVIEALIVKVLNSVKTRSEFSFMLACMALVERIRLKGIVNPPKLAAALPTATIATPSMTTTEMADSTVNSVAALQKTVLLPGMLYSSVCIRNASAGKCLDIDLFARLLGVEIASRLRIRLEQSFICTGHPAPSPQHVADVMRSMFGVGIGIGMVRIGNFDQRAARQRLRSAYRHRMPTAIPRREDTDIADDSDDDQMDGTATSAATNAASTTTVVPPVNTTSQPAIDQRELPDMITPETVAALVGEIAGQTDVDPMDLLGQFLRQEAGAIGVEDDEGLAEENNAVDVEANQSDDEGLPNLEEHEQVAEGAQTTSTVLDRFMGQMAFARHQPAGASSLEESDELGGDADLP